MTVAKKPGNVSLSWSKWMRPACATTFLFCRRKRAPVACNQSTWKPCSVTLPKVSNHLIYMSSSERQLLYISWLASFTWWCMSSWLIIAYRATPAYSKRRNSASEPLLMIGFQKWCASSPCTACSLSNVFKKDLDQTGQRNKRDRANLVQAVVHNEGMETCLSSVSDSVTLYPFPNISCFVDENNDNPEPCFFLTLEPPGPFLPGSFYAMHQGDEALPKVSWIRPSRTLALPDSNQRTTWRDGYPEWRPLGEPAVSARTSLPVDLYEHLEAADSGSSISQLVQGLGQTPPSVWSWQEMHHVRHSREASAVLLSAPSSLHGHRRWRSLHRQRGSKSRTNRSGRGMDMSARRSRRHLRKSLRGQSRVSLLSTNWISTGKHN